MKEERRCRMSLFIIIFRIGSVINLGLSSGNSSSVVISGRSQSNTKKYVFKIHVVV